MTAKGRVIVVTTVGGASGSRAAAAALTCAGSAPDRPGLLIEIGGRAPPPTLLASSGARELEERLAVHLPGLRAASRGQTCHLAAADSGSDTFEHIRAAVSLIRDSVAVVHAPDFVLQGLLVEPGIDLSGVLLRADLTSDRALTALAVRDLLDHGLLVHVLKRPLGWVPARRALFGVLPSEAPGGLPARIRESLLQREIPLAHVCYVESDDAKADPEGTAQQQRGGYARLGWGRGFHRDPERQARR